MLGHTALALGLLAQTAAAAPQGDRRPGDPGVRIWVSDTLYQVGAGARVYVKLREPGYLLVLHTDATGRIQVLYPLAPQNQTAVPAGDAFEVTGADDRATFRIETRGRGTLLAVRAPRPFQFDALRWGNRWDYDQSLLLQPTAGNPFAALLDIADRVADGSPYDYDVTAYGTPGTMVKQAASDTVCFSCLTARHPRTASSGAAGYGNGAVAIDHSYAAAGGSSVVDCSGANLVDSFCGVQDNSVTNTYTDNSTSQASSTIVEPVYVPLYIPFRRFRRPAPPAPAPPLPAITLPKPLRPVSRRLVPPPPRPRPPIVVVQPTAPSHPRMSSDQPEPLAVAATAQPQPPRIIRPAAITAPNTMAGLQRGITWSGSMGTGPAAMRSGSGPAAATTMARPMQLTPRTFVPSRAFQRAINARH